LLLPRGESGSDGPRDNSVIGDAGCGELRREVGEEVPALLESAGRAAVTAVDEVVVLFQ
jgi:hypothetical protein